MLDGGATAVIEAAEACGLALEPTDARDAGARPRAALASFCWWLAVSVRGGSS